MREIATGRYELAVLTPLAFGETGAGLRVSEQTPLKFDGRRYVWHCPTQPEEAIPSSPVVTTLASPSDSDHIVMTNQLLSVLSFLFDVPVLGSGSVVTGFRQESDPPLLREHWTGPRHVVAPCAGVEAAQDTRLRLVLGHYREARASQSSFYRYFAFYNALDAAFDGAPEDERDRFMALQLADEPPPAAEAGADFDWSAYLQKSLRNAVAHVIRDEGRRRLNPDDFQDRQALDSASMHLERLVRARVGQRWPQGVRRR